MSERTLVGVHADTWFRMYNDKQSPRLDHPSYINALMDWRERELEAKRLLAEPTSPSKASLRPEIGQGSREGSECVTEPSTGHYGEMAENGRSALAPTPRVSGRGPSGQMPCTHAFIKGESDCGAV